MEEKSRFLVEVDRDTFLSLIRSTSALVETYRQISDQDRITIGMWHAAASKVDTHVDNLIGTFSSKKLRDMIKTKIEQCSRCDT